MKTTIKYFCIAAAAAFVAAGMPGMAAAGDGTVSNCKTSVGDVTKKSFCVCDYTDSSGTKSVVYPDACVDGKPRVRQNYISNEGLPAL